MKTALSPFWIERFLPDPPREKDRRPPFRRDRGRILHSAAFRCLQAKTQIHAVGENDFYRTRLTHSLEVAQIGSSLVSQLKQPEAVQHLADCAATDAALLQKQLKPLLPSNDLIESLCFAHDIGHPPFGHGGEVALNFLMRTQGGFEGNAQTFRILTKLEPYTESAGMNLTRRTLLGVIKYPVFLDAVTPPYPLLDATPDARYINIAQWKPGKGIFSDDADMFHWVLQHLTENDRTLFTRLREVRSDLGTFFKSEFKSLDCSIMELADDIAYGVHDLEDAIVTGMVNPQQWQDALNALKTSTSPWIAAHAEALTRRLFSPHHFERKNAIGALVNYFITHVRWKITGNFDEPLLRYNAELPQDVVAVLQIFKNFVLKYVIQHVETQRIEYKGQRILTELFHIFESDPARLLPAHTAQRWQTAPDALKKRIICDYIASMSDAYAANLHKRF